MHVCHCRDGEPCHGDILIAAFKVHYPAAYDMGDATKNLGITEAHVAPRAVGGKTHVPACEGDENFGVVSFQ